MARARNIKPGFFQNEDIVELEFGDRLLFIGLWTLADREGRLEDRPKRIKMSLFPADEFDVEKGISELVRNWFVRRYEVCGKRYIQILNFKKHQKPHHQEKASEIPPPPDLRTESEINGTNPSDCLIADSLNTDSLHKAPSDETLEADEPAEVEIPLRGGETFAVTRSQIEDWGEAYPAVDVKTEINKAKAWLQANPKNTKSNGHRFVVNWLSRSQDRAPRVATAAGFDGYSNA